MTKIKEDCWTNELAQTKVTKCVVCRSTKEPVKLMCEADDGRIVHVCIICCGQITNEYLSMVKVAYRTGGKTGDKLN